MAIVYKAGAGTATSTITLAASVTAGDLVILTAVRNASYLEPITPNGATFINSIAFGPSTASATHIQMSRLTWTAGGTTVISSSGAFAIGYTVWRGQSTGTPIGGAGASAAPADGLAVLLPDFAQVTIDGTSFIVASYFHRQTTGLSAVTGMTECFDVGSSSSRVACSYMNTTNFTVRTSQATASNNWGSVICEILVSAASVMVLKIRAMAGCGR